MSTLIGNVRFGAARAIRGSEKRVARNQRGMNINIIIGNMATHLQPALPQCNSCALLLETRSHVGVPGGIDYMDVRDSAPLIRTESTSAQPNGPALARGVRKAVADYRTVI